MFNEVLCVRRKELSLLPANEDDFESLVPILYGEVVHTLQLWKIIEVYCCFLHGVLLVT